MLKRFYFSALLLFPALLFSQNAKDTTDVPGLVNEKYYTEHTYVKGADFTHDVGYNEPGAVDEEFDYMLGFHFTNFDSIADRHTYDLAKDTGFVRSKFGILSTWNWDYDDKAVITGTITILGKTKKSVAIEEDVRVIAGDGRIYIYKTSRSFTYLRSDG